MRCRRTPLLLACLAFVGSSLAAEEVRFEVPVRSQLDLRGYETVTLVPFRVAREDGDGPLERRGLDPEDELDRYIRSILRRRARLSVMPARLPDSRPLRLAELAQDRDFWRAVGSLSGADLILAGSLDYDLVEGTGYVVKEYPSPYDGRPLYRQALVEGSGFEFDVMLWVFDGRSGERLHVDNFRDSRQFDDSRTDPMAGMFEGLFALEDRIAAIFTQRRVATTRHLFRD